MKNLCFFNSAVAWGGGEKWHLEVSTHMHEKGYSVLTVVHEKSELLNRLKKNKIPNLSIQINNTSFLNPFKVNSIKKILVSHKIDTIILNLSRDLKLAGLAAKKAGVETIIYRRGSAIPIKNSILNRYYFKNVVTNILANSKATKNTITENNENLFPKEQIKIIYNALEISNFEKDNKSEGYVNNDNKQVVLVNLGRLEFQKNQKFLIYLAEELKKRKLSFHLIIGGEGRLRSELIQEKNERSLTEEISFPGFIEKPHDFLKSGDIFVLSSLWEGFGYVLAEAALCQKPIVAFDVSSNPEVVVNNKTGFLTPINEVEPFADAVESLIKDVSLREKMGSSGKEYVKKKFDKNTILRDIEHYLIHGE